VVDRAGADPRAKTHPCRFLSAVWPLKQTQANYHSAPVKPHSSREPNTYISGRTWFVYLVLFSFSVPWYWPSGYDATLFGIPTWVVVTLLSSFLISIYTAWLLLFRWPSKLDDSAQNDE